jgi:hypothetical protein
MRALGFDVKKPDVIKMVHDVDPNNAGSVDYEQFLEISKYGYGGAVERVLSSCAHRMGIGVVAGCGDVA